MAAVLVVASASNSLVFLFGWVKVRVRTTTRFYDMNGRETSFRGTPSGTQRTVWQFADCLGTSFGSDFKSDGSDAKTSQEFLEWALAEVFKALDKRPLKPLKRIEN